MFLGHGVIVRACSEASNYATPLLAALAAVAFWMGAYDLRGGGPVRTTLLLGSGVCLGLGVSLKAYDVFLAPAFVGAALLFPRAYSLRRRVRSILVPWAAGCLVGGLPIMYYFAQDPERFLFFNVGYHQETADWKMGDTSTARIWLDHKLPTARDLLLGREDGYCLVALVLASAAFLAWRNRGQAGAMRDGDRSMPISIAGLLVPAGLAAALAPTPVFIQYFSVPAVMLLLLAITTTCATGLFQHRRPAALATALFIAGYVGLRWDYFRGGLDDLGSPPRWAPSRMTQAGAEIRAALGGSPGVKVIATLAPLAVWRGGGRVPNEFATGPFLFRLGDHVGGARQSLYMMIPSPRTAADWLSRAGVDGVYLSRTEGPLEDALRAYARKQHFQRIDIGAGGILFLRR